MGRIFLSWIPLPLSFMMLLPFEGPREDPADGDRLPGQAGWFHCQLQPG